MGYYRLPAHEGQQHSEPTAVPSMLMRALQNMYSLTRPACMHSDEPPPIYQFPLKLLMKVSAFYDHIKIILWCKVAIKLSSHDIDYFLCSSLQLVLPQHWTVLTFAILTVFRTQPPSSSCMQYTVLLCVAFASYVHTIPCGHHAVLPYISPSLPHPLESMPCHSTCNLVSYYSSL